MDADYDLRVENKVETNPVPKSSHQQTGTFKNPKGVDPLTMSVGSNLLAMLNNRQSIQTSSNETEIDQKKGSSQHSAQMRKCMKNFNFKLDYSEIDRIIEEQEENQPVEEEEEVKAHSPKQPKPSQRRK